MGLFTVHNQGGVPYFFKTQPRGCLYFPFNTKVPCILLYNKGGGTQITKVCTNVHTCMYICHLAPPPPPVNMIFNERLILL